MSTAVQRQVAEPEFEKRQEVRSLVGLPAVSRVDDKDYSAQITNIAPRGAMLETLAPVDPGTSISLRCGSIVAEAVVVWKDNGHVGISFTDPLSDRELSEQLCRAAAIAARRQTRPSS